MSRTDWVVDLLSGFYTDEVLDASGTRICFDVVTIQTVNVDHFRGNLEGRIWLESMLSMSSHLSSLLYQR